MDSRKVSPTRVKILKKDGTVSLLEMEKDTVRVYGVKYPYRISGQHAGYVTSKWFKLSDAEQEFMRYAKAVNAAEAQYTTGLKGKNLSS